METTKGSSRQRSGGSQGSVNIEIRLSLASLFTLQFYSCQDLSSQNATLHQHLESVSTQATRIRQAADASAAQPAEEEIIDDADSRLSELRSVVSYLRKEKGIVDLQLEMSKQENERLKTHIERLTQTVQETRATLSEVRSFRSSVYWLSMIT